MSNKKFTDFNVSSMKSHIYQDDISAINNDQKDSLCGMRLSKSEPNENILDSGRTDGLLDRYRAVSLPNNGWGRT